jgi:hypothetical protein
MSLPGFSAERAIGSANVYRGSRRFDGAPHAVSAALGRWGWHSPAEWFWPCFRNCYDRCGGSGDLHVDMCSRFCYDICDANPWVVF